MPTPQPSSTTGGGIRDAATRKVGPLPAWGWGVIVVGGYVAWRVVRGGGSGGASGAGVPSVGGVSDAGGGGGSGGGGVDPTQAILDAIRNLPIPTGSGAGGSVSGGGTGGGAGAVVQTDPIPQQLIAALPSFEDVPGVPAGWSPSVPAGWSASNPITVTPEIAGGFGQAVVGGPFAPTAAQIQQIAATGSLPTGIFWGSVAGAYKVGSVAPAINVDLSAPSTDTATYLQQLFAIESGAKIDPSKWPSEATRADWRQATIAQLTASIVGSGGQYQADFGSLTADQIKAAANYGGPFTAVNLNPIYATALYNAANAGAGGASGAPPTISGATQINSPTIPAPSTSGQAMTLSQFNAINRAGVIERGNAVGNPTTAQVNQTIANNYAKYLASLT
jgi:hypothetical protein